MAGGAHSAVSTQRIDFREDESCAGVVGLRGEKREEGEVYLGLSQVYLGRFFVPNENGARREVAARTGEGLGGLGV